MRLYLNRKEAILIRASLTINSVSMSFEQQ